ncbi:class I SAM-dependent methyltransferase [Nocardioides dilutus]
MEHVVNESYVAGAPHPDNLVGLFRDRWVSALPGHESGDTPLFADPRLEWAIGQANGVQGKTVLELGPLEGGHSYMLQNGGAAEVTSIEANTLSYLKCLVVQQIYGLDKVRFELGNFLPWLEEPRKGAYDLVVAAGVLYHTIDPVRVLERLAQLSPELYIWTHYMDLGAMPEADVRYQAGVVGVENARYRGLDYQLFRRRYQSGPTDDPKFCGGVHENPAWIEKGTIRAVLDLHGFDVVVAHDHLDHPSGPAASFFARKRGLRRRVAREGEKARGSAARIRRRLTNLAG